MGGDDGGGHVDELAARALAVILRRPVGRDRRLDRCRKAVDRCPDSYRRRSRKARHGGVRSRTRCRGKAKKFAADDAAVLLPVS